MNINQLKRIALVALERSHQTYQELGASGEEVVKKNEFGDAALKLDIEAEKAVIAVFREAKVPIRMISEEHGTTDIGEKPIYLGILDGLDGSNAYKGDRLKCRYGTMFGIFSNLDPLYCDYILGGFMEHSTKRLFFASKGEGCFLESDGKTTPIHCSANTGLDKETRIHADFEFDNNRNITFIQDTFTSHLKGYTLLHERSMGVHLADVASGHAELALLCTRKRNLEIAIAYGMITEAGGVMVAVDGTSLGPKKYLEFGQDGYLPVISASTMELAKELIEHIAD